DDLCPAFYQVIDNVQDLNSIESELLLGKQVFFHRCAARSGHLCQAKRLDSIPERGLVRAPRGSKHCDRQYDRFIEFKSLLSLLQFPLRALELVNSVHRSTAKITFRSLFIVMTIQPYEALLKGNHSWFYIRP